MLYKLKGPGPADVSFQQKFLKSEIRNRKMLTGFTKIIEERIRRAQKKGMFENLEGAGKPLKLAEDSHIAEDLRLAHKILKNADCLPPQLQLRREIRQLEDLLDNIPDEKEKYRQMKRINYRIMRLNMMGKNSPLLDENEVYYRKTVEKLGQK